MKRILTSLLLLPFIFSIGSLLISQTANAESFKLNVKVKNDLNNNKAHNDAPTDSCYNGTVKIRVTDDAGSREYSWDSQTNCQGTSLKQNIGVILEDGSSYRVRLLSPSGTDFNYIRLYNLSSSTSTNKTAGLTSTVTVPKGNYEVAFGLKPPQTLTFSGYVFVDNGAGNNAGNGKKDTDEKCYKGQYTVQAQTPAPIVSKTVTGKEDCSGTYSLSKITTNEVSLRLYLPTGYTATKLNYRFNHLGDITDQVKSGASISLGNSSPVNFGIKPNISPTSTKTPDRCDCDRSGSCAQKCTNAKNPVCKNPGSNSSTCVACTPEKKGACSDNQKCVNNKCVPKVTPTNTPKPTNPPGSSCDKNPPSLEITPSNRTGNPGDKKEYDIKVINNDKGADCNPVDFVLSKEHLPGTNWTGNFNDNTLANIPKNGGSKSTKFHVKSANNASAGPKTITLGVRRSSQTTAQVQVNTAYTVEEKPQDCTRVDPSLNILPRSVTANPGQAARYDIIIENKDTGSCATRNLKVETETPNDNWKTILASETINLPVGGKDTSDLVVTSPDTATPGNKSIKVNVKNSNNDIIATNSVSYVVPGSECVAVDPEFSITPQTKTGQAGDTITYSVTVKNIDVGPCANRNLTLEVVPPTQDWDAGFFGQDFTLAPGEEKVLAPSLTSPAGIAEGEYNTVLNLLDFNKNKIGSIVAIYKVGASSGQTILNLTLGIDGIGSTIRVPDGFKNPIHLNRNLTVKLFNTSDNSLFQTYSDQTFTYNPTLEKFETQVQVPLETGTIGNYNLYVQGPRFLYSQYPGSISVTGGQTKNLSSNNFLVITGNINNSDLSENRIDLMDYNVLIACSIYSQDRSLCDENPNNQDHSDLDDDGIVNEDDYTLFLREFSSQQGIILPE